MILILGSIYIIISSISVINKFPLFNVRVINREKISCTNPIIEAHIPIAREIAKYTKTIVQSNNVKFTGDTEN